MGSDVSDTRGREMLLALSHWCGVTQVEIARACGVKQPAVSHWFSGDTRPHFLFRQTLSRVYGIPFDAWLTDFERGMVYGTNTVPAPTESQVVMIDAAASDPAEEDLK